MRLKSGIWVMAYVRRCQSAGAFAAVVRHGDDDAGAIFIKVNRLDGTCFLYGPAPAGFDGAETERRWTPRGKAEGLPEADADALMRREVEFDSDVWLVEIEDRLGRHFLGDELAR